MRNMLTDEDRVHHDHLTVQSRKAVLPKTADAFRNEYKWRYPDITQGSCRLRLFDLLHGVVQGIHFLLHFLIHFIGHITFVHLV